MIEKGIYRYPTLETGVLLKRYKRFFADIQLASGEVITAHCLNTGPMTSDRIQDFGNQNGEAIANSQLLKLSPSPEPIDPVYGQLLREVVAEGVEVLPCRFEVTPQEICYLGLAEFLPMQPPGVSTSLIKEYQ